MYTIHVCTIEGIMEMEMFPLTELVRERGRSSCRWGEMRGMDGEWFERIILLMDICVVNADANRPSEN